MSDTVESRHRCGLCRKTFKQKSSLVRHAKRCTLEPTPSLRQRACRSCTIAKARCDLERPTCSRCNTRGIHCAYARLVPTGDSREEQQQYAPAAATTATTTAAATGNSGDYQMATTTTTTTTVTPVTDFDSIDLGLGLDSTLCDANRAVNAYLAYTGNLTSLPSPGPTIHPYFMSDMFPPATDTTNNFTIDCSSTSQSTTGAYTASNTHSLTGTSSAGSPNVPTDPDSGSPGTHGVAQLQNFGDGSLASGVAGSLSRLESSIADVAATVSVGDIEPWMVAYTAKPPGFKCSQPMEYAVDLVFRVLRSWPRMLAKGIQLPPIIHPFQVCRGERPGESCGLGRPNHLARCVTLCKMWVGQADGSGQMVQNAVREEMESIMTKFQSYDGPTMLAAMQSLAILMIMLIFPANRQSTTSTIPQYIIEMIHDMGNYALSTGMLLHEESTHERPPWCVWAHIEAKRRTLMSIFFLHWAYSVAHESLPFNCMKLGRMLAPSPKWLWQASDEKVWSSLYSKWLAQWNGKELVQVDFFFVHKGPLLSPRLELWLEDADELGIMIVSICMFPLPLHPNTVLVVAILVPLSSVLAPGERVDVQLVT